MSGSAATSATNDNHAHTISRSASTIGQAAASTHSHAPTLSGTLDSSTNTVPTIYVNYIIKADK